MLKGLKLMRFLEGNDPHSSSQTLAGAQETNSGQERFQDEQQDQLIATHARYQPTRGNRYRSQNYQKIPRFSGKTGSTRIFNNSSNSWHQDRSWQPDRPYCQICGKQGHIATHCWHRYDPNNLNQPQVNVSQLPFTDSATDHTSTMGINSTLDNKCV